MLWALASGVLAFLIVPFLLPNESSGTLTNVEAAGPNAEFAELNGVMVHVERRQYSGDCRCEPPVIILLHGFGASTFSWREVVDSLATRGDVIAYDRPAFGFTERPTDWAGINPYGFTGNLDLLGSVVSTYGTGRKVILVGHSAGGQLAAEYARQHPDKVTGLVLVDPAILTAGGPPDWLGFVWQIPQIDRLGPILVKGFATAGDQILLQSFVDQSLITDEVLAGYHQPLKVRGWEAAFWRFITAPRDNQLASRVGDITTPTLIISGDSDTIVPTSDSVKLQTLIPGSWFELIEKSGHLPHEERPDLFLKALSVHWTDLGP